MSPAEMIDALGRVFSDQDPVTYQEEEMEARAVLEQFSNSTDARRIRIVYFGAKGEVSGTFGGMLKDRQAMTRRNESMIRGRRRAV